MLDAILAAAQLLPTVAVAVFVVALAVSTFRDPGRR
jgi:hypothetical protein